MSRGFLAIVLLLAGNLSAAGQDPEAAGRQPALNPGVSRVLDSLRSQFARVEDYQVQLRVALDFPGLRMRPKRMTFSFRQPDQVSLKARGLAIVPRSGVFMSPDTLLGNLHDAVVVRDPAGTDCPCLVIRGETKMGDEMRPVTEITVDTTRWVVRDIRTTLGDDEVLRVAFDHGEPAPGIFLPMETRVKFNIGAALMRDGGRRTRRSGSDQTGPDLPQAGLPPGQPTEVPRAGEAVITFSKYRINTGLPDALFEKKP